MAEHVATTEFSMKVQGRVDEIFAEWDKPDSPGCALGVVQDNRLVYARGYGMANLDYDVPIAPSSIFHVASVSKQFAAMAIALLGREGVLSLDADIRTYLPELPDFGAIITLRHLVLHTSGLRDQWEILGLSGWREHDVFTNADVLEAVLRQRELNFAPGEEHMYSNTGYTLMGIIVERVTGMRLRAFTEERFFGPLGMTRTHFHDDHMEIVKGRAYAYEPEKDGTFRISIPSFDTVGATSLFTTVEDLARWVENLSEGRVGGKDLIGEATTSGKLNNGEPLEYAYGLAITEYRGARVVEHSGADAGYRAHLMWFPEERFATIVLCNLATMRPNELCRRVADVYLAGRLGPKAEEERPIELPAEELERRAGLYYHDVTRAARRLVLRDGALVLDLGPGVPLTPVASDRFVGLGGLVDLQFGESGDEVPMLNLRLGTGKAISFRRIETFGLGDAGLGEYAGGYFSDELETAFTLEQQEAGLVLRRRKHEDEALTPILRDVFTGANFMTLVFDRDETEQVSGFRLMGGRVRNLRFSKR